MSAITAADPAFAQSPVPFPTSVVVDEGPALLAGSHEGPGLAAHRRRYGQVPRISTAELQALVGSVALRGRGGAAFPFLTKLDTVVRTRGRAVLVVNLAEGEPASAKDHALATARPHLVLDGLTAVARALGTRDLHVVVPGERPAVVDAVRRAVLERGDRISVHVAPARFVAGQATAVLELIAGREALPVTTWTPTARRGHRGRPTLLSNGETWARVGLLTLAGQQAYASLGTRDEPGTALLTLVGTAGGHRVVEVPFGSRLADVLGPDLSSHPALVGGFHGQWSTPHDLASAVVSLAPGAAGTPGGFGAGAVLSLRPGECPGAVTAQVTRYLAAQSAGRCGPCRIGLPALADAVGAATAGDAAATDRVDRLQLQVDGRGACAHPDGTARLVRSLLTVFPDCAVGHRGTSCSFGGSPQAHGARR